MQNYETDNSEITSRYTYAPLQSRSHLVKRTAYLQAQVCITPQSRGPSSFGLARASGGEQVFVTHHHPLYSSLA